MNIATRRGPRRPLDALPRERPIGRREPAHGACWSNAALRDRELDGDSGHWRKRDP